MLLAALGTLAILRLRRVPRPEFVEVQQFANRALVLGEVVLLRSQNARSLRIGWSIRCQSNEVLALREHARPNIQQRDASVFVVYGQHARWQIDLPNCEAVLQH